MNESLLSLVLNDKEKIVFEINNTDEQLSAWSEVSIVFIQGNRRWILLVETIREALESFSLSLEEVLENKLILDSSITKDIGFMYNEYLYALYAQESLPSDIKIISDDDVDTWVGKKYHLWGHEYVIAWLYNDMKGAIIFEITPLYPLIFNERENNERKSFEQWMKQYHYYVKTEIPQETAKEWLRQVRDLQNTPL